MISADAIFDRDTDSAVPAVRLRGVKASYRKRHDVLRNLDFEAYPGAIAVISGPPGAGKTALIDVLRLFLNPTEGTAEVLGVNVSKLSGKARAKLKRDIGFMSESPVLADHMDAFENVSLPLRLAGAKANAYAGDVEDLLKFLGVPERDGRIASALTGSEKRRAALARAVVGRPRLILAEEPTAGLSQEIAGRMLRLLASMRRAGTTIIVTTQDENLAEQLGAQLWRMRDGRIAPVIAETAA
jgi:cell division transport system ATP-binding protein